MTEIIKDANLLDRKLLEAAANGWTGEQMEAVYTIGAAEAIVRVRELLRSMDVFDMLERKKLILLSAYKMKEKLDKMDLIIDENPKITEAYLKVLRAISDFLERQGKVSDAEIDAAAKAQSREIVRLVAAGYETVKTFLSDNYPDLVDLAELDAVFEVGIREALNDD